MECDLYSGQSGNVSLSRSKVSLGCLDKNELNHVILAFLAPMLRKSLCIGVVAMNRGLTGISISRIQVGQRFRDL